MKDDCYGLREAATHAQAELDVLKGMERLEQELRTTPPPDLPLPTQFSENEQQPLLDDCVPAWWEIAGAMLVMVVVIAILLISAWSLS